MERMSDDARIRIRPLPAPTRIDDRIYGHFLESAFFRNIEGGVVDAGSRFAVGGDGPLAEARRDVIEACRDLGLPVVRWPGGNFTSGYRWQDGTGPRDERPRRLELAWGSVESNRFGTPEFLAWCEAVGTTPYLAHRGDDVEDAVRWAEYVLYPGDTELTRRRAADGRDRPWDVPLWGLGNEVYGEWQHGHRSVERYVADTREHARFLDQVAGPREIVAVGHTEPEWLKPVVAGLGDVVDFVSIHLYGAALHRTLGTGPDAAATGAEEARADEFAAIAAQPAYFEAELAAASDLIASTPTVHGPKRALAIALDEWNIRHLEPAVGPEPEPADDGGSTLDGAPVDPAGAAAGSRWRVNRYSSRTLADALFYAGVFHALHRAAGRAVPVRMANTVNLVNANGLLEVRPDGVVRSATFAVWDLYQNHHGRVPLSAVVEGPSRSVDLRLGAVDAPADLRTRPDTSAMLDVSATTADDGTLRLAVINRSPVDAISARLELPDGLASGAARRRVLGAECDDLFAVNRLSDPDRVVLGAEERIELRNGEVEFPAHSVTLLVLG
jgi:alpha-L-arabinofuranosidase